MRWSTTHRLAPSVHVVTDVLDVEVSLAGGELRRVDLLAYPRPRTRRTYRCGCSTAMPADSLFVLQSGLAPVNDESAPTHQALYRSDAHELRLSPGQDEIRLPLSWSDGHGVSVTKTLSFHRGSIPDRPRLPDPQWHRDALELRPVRADPAL